MKKVLVVSYYFPPLNIMASKRYGTMCKYFEEYGYMPYVITTDHGRSCGPNAISGLKMPVGEEQVIKIGKEKDNSKIQNVYCNLLLQIMESQKIASRTLTISSIGWYETIRKDLDLSKLKDIDLIIGTFPPVGNLFVAKYLSRKLKCPYIAEIRDLISDYTETDPGYRNSRLIDKALERYLLSHAAGIVTVTTGFRDVLKKRFPDKPFKVVFNGWDDEKKEDRSGPEGGTKYLYYAGLFYLHRLESFELLAKCVKRINQKEKDHYKLIVRSAGPKDLDMKAKKIVQKEEMQEYVHILEAASEEIVKKEQANADINVVLSTIHKEDHALMTTVPGKVYELLKGDAPVLAIVPENSDVYKILKYTNKGIASTSEDEIIDFILQENKKYTGNRKVSYFSRRKQAERLCEFIDKVLGDV